MLKAYSSCFLLLFIFFGCSKENKQSENSYINSYYPLIYKADLAFLVEDYKKTYEYLKEAFKNQKPINLPPYYELDKMAESCARLGKKKEAVKYLRILIEEMGYEISTFEEDSAYEMLKDYSDWRLLKEEYSILRARYIQSVNLELRKEILSMKANDQLYRSKENYDNYRAEQALIDSLNHTRLVEIFETYGYPDERIIGHRSIDGNFNTSLEAILLHSKDSIRLNYFIPKLKTFVKVRKMRPNDFR